MLLSENFITNRQSIYRPFNHQAKLKFVRSNKFPIFFFFQNIIFRFKKYFKLKCIIIILIIHFK